MSDDSVNMRGGSRELSWSNCRDKRPGKVIIGSPIDRGTTSCDTVTDRNKHVFCESRPEIDLIATVEL